MKVAWTLIPLVTLLAGAGCGAGGGETSPSLTRRLDFGSSDPGWSAGFADVAVAQAPAIGFVADHRALPAPLLGSGLYQAGANNSDDLCMWWTGRVDGFEPGAEYRIGFEVGIASDAGFGCDVGIAASTYVKAGVAAYQPGREDEAGFWRMNVDKGIPAGDGTQALTLGDIRNSLPTCSSTNPPWDRRVLASGGRELVVTAPSDGALWFFVMTDSAWEAWYDVYFTHLAFTVRRR